MSAVFFILFFTLDFNREKHKEKTWKSKDEMIHKIAKNAQATEAIRLEQIGRLTAPEARFSSGFYERYKDTLLNDSIFALNDKNNFEFDSLKYNFKKIGFLGPGMSKIAEEMTYSQDRRTYIYNKVLEAFHTLPKAFFLLLPVFALLLSLFYIRHKQFRFYHHAIFTLYYFSLSFFLASLIILLVHGYFTWHWFILLYLAVALLIWSLVYLFFAMLNFYRQNYPRTFFKYVSINFVFFFFMMVIVSTVMFFSVTLGGH